MDFAQRSLRSLAWQNVALHIIALVLADQAIRPGSPLVPRAERLAYLADYPVSWTIAWISWMLCAVALIAFLAVVARCLGQQVRLAQMGLTVAVVGMISDLFCDLVYILVLPRLASWQPNPEALFLTVERNTGFVSMTVANGAYSVAVLLFTLALRQRPGTNRAMIGVGYAVTMFGLLLAAAGLTGVPRHAEWTAPPTIVSFCVWCVLVARALES